VIKNVTDTRSVLME